MLELFRKPGDSQQIYKQMSSSFIHQKMRLKHVEQKKTLGRHNKVAKLLFNYF